MKKLMKIRAICFTILLASMLVINAQSTNSPASARLKTPVTDEGLKVTKLDKVSVYGTTDSAFATGFMPDVDRTAIYAGKKTTVTDLEKMPVIPDNNYRQAFSLTPGVFISEVQNRGIVNITYRGIGDPHESQDILTLQDGIPIQNNIFGYSTSYYSTPLQYVKKIEFIRGGSALLYGPQPGPVINYVTIDPVMDRGWSFSTDQVFGSYGQYDSFTKVSGTEGDFSYIAAFTHNQSDGDRSNGGFGMNGGNMKLVWHPTTDTKLTFGLDAFESQSEEAGRLSAAQFAQNRYQTLTPGDGLNWNRYIGSLHLEHRFSEDTLLTAKTWGGYTSRYSSRERFNGARISLGNSAIDLQEFYSFGFDARVAHNWEAWGNEHTLTAGFTAYYNDSPRSQKRGAVGGYQGNTRYIMDRYTTYGAVFAENKFTFGHLSLIPAVRIDTINNQVNETFNADKTTAPLINMNETETVPLFGFGIQYDLDDANNAYFNFSEGYKPPGFDNLAPTGNSLAATDIQAGHTYSYELGVRGSPLPYFAYDTSFFLTDYIDQFGNVTVSPGISQFRNSGSAYYRGWDAAAELDLFALVDSVSPVEKGQKSFVERYGNLVMNANVSLLDAQFYAGPLTGKTPDFAPSYLVKFGPTYNYKGKVIMSFSGQIVDQQYWQDSNLPANGVAIVPGYAVYDFSLQAAVYKDIVTLLGGVNNVFNDDYYSRVRSDGIEPAAGRNFYAGFRLSF